MKFRFHTGSNSAFANRKRHQVLDGLLAQVVVDPENLGLVEDLEDVRVEPARGREVVSERLLDHDPRVGVSGPVEAGGAELARDHREELGRGRQIEDVVQVLSGALVELAQNLVELGVDLVVVERAGHVAHVVDQAGQDLGVRAPA